MTEGFPACELHERVQRATPWLSDQPGYDARRKIKGLGSGDLEKCRLMELVQYDCSVRDRIECQPVIRLFRR